MKRELEQEETKQEESRQREFRQEETKQAESGQKEPEKIKSGEKNTGKKRRERKKPYRSSLSNILWSFRELLKGHPVIPAMMALSLPLEVFLEYGACYLPALAVAQVTGGEGVGRAVGSVGLFLLAMFAAEALSSFLGEMKNIFLNRYRNEKGQELDGKSMGCLYQTYERKETRDLHDRALIATQMWNGSMPLADMPRRSANLVKNLVCYCLFGSMISFVSPLLVPILTIAPGVNWLCARAYRRWEYAHRSQWTDIDSKLGYVQNKPSDFSAAKDIRIYGMAGWFRETARTLSEMRRSWDKKIVLRSFLSRIADLLVILLRDGAAYALLIRMTLAGEITVDRFVLYFAAISSFAGFIGSMIDEWNGIHQASLGVCDFREYMEMPERDGTGEAQVEAHLSAPPEIIFDHVSFRYEGAEQDTLRDISFTIKPGEKVALVGLNGAGKTTLVKLLCGLYLPAGGQIRINGVPSDKFYRREYYRLFSPVFQEVSTAFFSLGETVSGKVGEGTDYDRALRCMEQAGLGEKVGALPLGVRTKLDKQVNREGIELSGGEVQKLMLARALYKDAPVLVLDEPTAALDPVAENQIYLQYNEMTRNKSSLFISHRLASTRFCDRILYLKEGEIAEEGSHEELMELGGEYSRLYELQSCWYREDYMRGETCGEVEG